MARSMYWRWDDGPRVGEVFYVASSFGVIGNACKGGADIAPEFVLPTGVVLAVSADNPVRCFYEMSGSMREVGIEVCPQAPTGGKYGPAFVPDLSSGLFPVAMGNLFEIWVPVLAKRPMTEVQVSTPVWAVSDLAMWSFPSVSVSVAPNPPLVGYPPNPTTDISENSAHLRAIAENHYTPGTAFIELGGGDGAFDVASRSFAIGDVDSSVVEATVNGLEPGTEYHWRVRFVPAQGASIVGAPQAFKTAGVRRYAISVSASAGGSTRVTPAGELQPAGSVLTLVAEPDTGYRFEGWFADAMFFSAEASISWVVEGAVELEARFTPIPPTQTGDGGSGGGTGTAGSPGNPATGGNGEVSGPAQGCSTAGGGLVALPWLVLPGLARRVRRRQET